ncbi:phosphopantothenate--cysteine ligase [Enterococcus asini]|uniref:phosphopantothenate--cysteine ligase n=1 Tax=Enterococcus asini TaxID=57732 RepID=UPI00241E460F|nr:phosphopantothenate--cysteine ligase [Enterococcus asini]
MRILITAGGTAEKIDQVRSITNHSSGSLGVELAKAALQKGTITVDYVLAKGALLPPKDPRITLHPVADTADLEKTMVQLLQAHTYGAVIHAMAVSDFTPEIAATQEDFIQGMNTWLATKKDANFTAEDVSDLLSAILEKSQSATKLSSKTEHLFMVLKQTPKVIGRIKALQPETQLVGFKLLVDVSSTELLTVARAALEKNQADYVLANDLTSIHEGQHHGYLLDKKGIVAEANTKAEIAHLILDTLLERQEVR